MSVGTISSIDEGRALGEPHLLPMMGMAQVRGISTTRGWERRRPRRPIIESVDRKRRATASPTVSERSPR